MSTNNDWGGHFNIYVEEFSGGAFTIRRTEEGKGAPEPTSLGPRGAGKVTRLGMLWWPHLKMFDKEGYFRNCRFSLEDVKLRMSELMERQKPKQTKKRKTK